MLMSQTKSKIATFVVPHFNVYGIEYTHERKLEIFQPYADKSLLKISYT